MYVHTVAADPVLSAHKPSELTAALSLLVTAFTHSEEFSIRGQTCPVQQLSFNPFHTLGWQFNPYSTSVELYIQKVRGTCVNLIVTQSLALLSSKPVKHTGSPLQLPYQTTVAI